MPAVQSDPGSDVSGQSHLLRAVLEELGRKLEPQELGNSKVRD